MQMAKYRKRKEYLIFSLYFVVIQDDAVRLTIFTTNYKCDGVNLAFEKYIEDIKIIVNIKIEEELTFFKSCTTIFYSEILNLPPLQMRGIALGLIENNQQINLTFNHLSKKSDSKNDEEIITHYNNSLTNEFSRCLKNYLLTLNSTQCNNISKIDKILIRFATELEYYLNWHTISKNPNHLLDFLYEFRYRIIWRQMTILRTFSEYEIHIFDKLLIWDRLKINTGISDKFILEHITKIHPCMIYLDRQMHEPFLCAVV